MRKIILILALVVAGCVAGHAQTRKLHIVSANDMHATIDNMPMLASIVDSLRAIDNQLLVFSAGDNRTGNPINDLYSIPTYPMTALMNLIGFDASAFGNHEFDNRQTGLSTVLATSNFPYLCCNFKCDPSLNISALPYKIFEVEGVKVGVIGVVQLGLHGIPDAHPDLLKGMEFEEPETAIRKYVDLLRSQVNVLILLSHMGFEDDVELAGKFPSIDVILGGHTHTQLDGGEMHNGVLITQNVNKLKKVTYTTINVVDGKVVGKEAKNIDVQNYPQKNEVAQCIVDFFNRNPEFQRVLAEAISDFTTYEQLGCLMCDAMISESGADLALQNYGGVRYGEKPAGPITVNDVLKLDPFGNQCVEMTISGEEFKRMLISCYDNSEDLFPFIGGAKCDVIFNKKDTTKIADLKLYTLDGKKLNLKKKYKVVTNSYVAAICDAPRSDQGQAMGIVCSDMLMAFLEKMKTVDYGGVTRLNFIK